MSDALAVGLQQRGVEAGDRVAMYLQNIPQVVHRGARGLEVRRRRRAVQSDAARARARQDPAQLRLPAR